MAQEAVKFYCLPEEKVVTIHNGVDLPSFTDPQGEDHTILFVGRLTWRKGVKYLIDAMPHVLSEYPDTKLLLVGDGDQRTPLQKQIEKLRIENSVLFLGNISTEKLYSLYCKANVYVQPSLYEPCGIAILEAMSMGKPVVSTHVGGVPELITNGEEGFLVKPGNNLELAKAIINVFSDDSCRKRLASNAKNKVLQEFSWEAVAKKTLDLYTNLLDDSKTIARNNLVCLC
jgi:glycosyltransferase involved in cell wall biosynthesis